MPPAPATQPLVVKAPAKLNLFLEVLGGRDDGYHEIVTVMQTITLFDELIFSLEPEALRLVCNSDDVPHDEGNLVLRAARMLREHAATHGGARITLVKNIPVGAGLGGGSSDAAATLKALNTLWGLDLPQRDICAMAARLGSDVNFFLVGGTAICRGRGERVEPIANVPRRVYVVVYPEVNMSTREIYENLPAALTTSVKDHKLIVSGMVCTGGAGEGYYNRLESVALGLCEPLSGLKETMQVVGLQGVTMTGSGSAFFGIAKDRKGAQAIAEQLRETGCGRVFVTQSLT